VIKGNVDLSTHLKLHAAIEREEEEEEVFDLILGTWTQSSCLYKRINFY
jgi:hypothetical protein